MSTASLSRHPRVVTRPKLNMIKNELIEAVGFRLVPQGLDSAERLIVGFSQEKAQCFNVLSMASSAFADGDPTTQLATRKGELLKDFFPRKEQVELSRCLIRHHDGDNFFHCDQLNCGESCTFAPATCLNDDCPVVVSRKWLAKHDSTCPQKVVPCERGCGDSFYRRLTDSHLQNACPLRPVDCPFAEFGCMTGSLCRHHRSASLLTICLSTVAFCIFFHAFNGLNSGINNSHTLSVSLSIPLCMNVCATLVFVPQSWCLGHCPITWTLVCRATSC